MLFIILVTLYCREFFHWICRYLHQFLSLLWYIIINIIRIYTSCSITNYCVQYHRLWHWDQTDGWLFNISLCFVQMLAVRWYFWYLSAMFKNTHNKRPISSLTWQWAVSRKVRKFIQHSCLYGQCYRLICVWNSMPLSEGHCDINVDTLIIDDYWSGLGQVRLC